MIISSLKDMLRAGTSSCRCPSRRVATDSSAEQTDAASFAVLEPAADGFRNYFGKGQRRSPAEMQVDRASMLTLSVPEMTVRSAAAGPECQRRTGRARGIHQSARDAEQRLLREPA